MQLVVFGAGGNVGQRIVSEALHRQHRVTAAVRDEATMLPQHNLDVVEADATDAMSVARVSWTYISPAAEIRPGRRTGEYRVSGDQLLVNEEGQSTISFEDYAVAVLDQIEQGAHRGERISVAN